MSPRVPSRRARSTSSSRSSAIYSGSGAQFCTLRIAWRKCSKSAIARPPFCAIANMSLHGIHSTASPTITSSRPWWAATSPTSALTAPGRAAIWRWKFAASTAPAFGPPPASPFHAAKFSAYSASWARAAPNCSSSFTAPSKRTPAKSPSPATSHASKNLPTPSRTASCSAPKTAKKREFFPSPPSWKTSISPPAAITSAAAWLSTTTPGSRQNAEKKVADLAVKTPTIRQLIRNLSGGNQQRGHSGPLALRKSHRAAAR